MPYETSEYPVKEAATRLQTALKSLEKALGPMTRRLNDLEQKAVGAAAFDEDRANLARELDAAKAREAEYENRANEFKALAEESARELEQAMQLVQMAMSQNQ